MLHIDIKSEYPPLNVPSDQVEKGEEDTKQDLLKIHFIDLNLNPKYRASSRRRVSGKSNFTASLINLHNSPTLHEKFSLENSSGIELAKRIKHHSYIGMQIFYYMAVAYYKTEAFIDRDTTILQHGTSYCKNCQAAHSCILPAVKDNYWDQLINKVQTKGMDEELESKFLLYGASPEIIDEIYKKGLNSNRIQALASSVDELAKTHMLTFSKHLFHEMNSTVEAPAIVNIYDCKIEKYMRPQAESLLNEVANGLHPYEALKRYQNLL